MLQVAKALSFLHDDAKLVHGNLTPEAIVINAKVRHDGCRRTTCRTAHAPTRYKATVMPPAAAAPPPQGDWKLAGFAFCNSVRMEGDKPAPFNYAEFDPAFPAFAQPALNYLGAMPADVLAHSPCASVTVGFGFFWLAHRLDSPGVCAGEAVRHRLRHVELWLPDLRAVQPRRLAGASQRLAGSVHRRREARPER